MIAQIAIDEDAEGSDISDTGTCVRCGASTQSGVVCGAYNITLYEPVSGP